MSRTEFACPHDHDYLSPDHRDNERRTWLVIALTLTTMVVEISAGLLFGSMALLADGWHMASHASALGITALAYYLSRKHRRNPRFTFGTGKIGDLAGYSSALLLLMIASIMAYESLIRLLSPVEIRFNEAIVVAVAGLAVNLVSALLLKEDHRGHDHDHDHDHDLNLRSAYLHVLADALTSILAITALTFGKFMGWSVLDPVMGLVGALVISRWSFGLMRDTGQVLLDYNANQELAERITQAVRNRDGLEVDDLHVWRLGPSRYGAIVSVRSRKGQELAEVRDLLCELPGLSHLTIEVNPAGRD